MIGIRFQRKLQVFAEYPTEELKGPLPAVGIGSVSIQD